MRWLFRCVRNWIFYKNIDEKKLNIKHIFLKSTDLSYFNLSSSSIISFTYEGKILYFRECQPLLRRKEYYSEAIERFFATLDHLNINREHFKQKIPIVVEFDRTIKEEFQEYLALLYKRPRFVKTLSNADAISHKMNFSIWEWEEKRYTAEFFESFGFKNMPEKFRDIAIYFIWYIRGVSAAYKTRNISCSKSYSYFSAAKSISTKIVADSIGLEHMIPQTSFSYIDLDDGRTLFGVISEAANGNRMIDSKISINGSLQKELMNLNLLDLICFQPDHGINNYNVYEKNGNCFICAFDNDNPNTFLPVPCIKYNFLKCSSIVNEKGRLNRPYIDKKLYDKIRNLDISVLIKRLNPYLNYIQLFSLIVRLKLIKRMLEKTINDNPSVALYSCEWNQDTIEDELSGKFGRTYLTIISEIKGKEAVNFSVSLNKKDLLI